MITRTIPTDAERITEIALISKAFWGYSEELVESWRDDLTVTSKMIETMKVFKFLQEDVIVGFYILNIPDTDSVELEFLFVLPDFIGKGIGEELLNNAVKEEKLMHCHTMTVLADPNAETFYQSQGFKVIEKKKSSIPNRFLPVMEKDLKQ